MTKADEKKVEATVDGTDVNVPVQEVTDAPAAEKAPEPEKKTGWKSKILKGLKVAGEVIVCGCAGIGAVMGVKNAVTIGKMKNASTPALPGSVDDQSGETPFGGDPFGSGGNPF